MPPASPPPARTSTDAWRRPANGCSCPCGVSVVSAVAQTAHARATRGANAATRVTAKLAATTTVVRTGQNTRPVTVMCGREADTDEACASTRYVVSLWNQSINPDTSAIAPAPATIAPPAKTPVRND